MTEPPTLPGSSKDTGGEAWVNATGRAAVYAFLSRSLVFPTSESRELLDGTVVPLLASLRSTHPRFDHALDRALSEYEVDADELRSAHGRVFTHIENRDCPAHESAYCPGDVFRRADVMADIAAFYTAHGLQTGGTSNERVDHIGTELEFMFFMARKEAYAIEHLGRDEIEECRRTQQVFLRDHLACWAPGIAARLGLVADHSFFRSIALMLDTWIEAECIRFGVEPAARNHEPQPMPPPDDGLCGIDAEGTSVEIAGAGR